MNKKSKKKIILINGKKRSGKDFVAQQLKYYLENQNFKMIPTTISSFADPLKEIIYRTFDILPEELDLYKNNPHMFPVLVPEGDENVLSFRQLDFRYILQRFGTEGMKPVMGDNIWASLMVDKCLKLFENYDIVLVPDFRFLIEIEELRNPMLFEDYEVITVNIKNTNNPVSKDQHASEIELDNFKFDFYLDNSKMNDSLHLLTQFKSLLSEFII